jgi:hypothetical protein
MNASMARRIRCAESSLIYAIDRQYGEQREQSQAAQPQTHAIRFPVVDPNGAGPDGWKPETRHEIRILRKTMGTNMSTAEASPALIPAAVHATSGKEYIHEEVR